MVQLNTAVQSEVENSITFLWATVKELLKSASNCKSYA